MLWPDLLRASRAAGELVRVSSFSKPHSISTRRRLNVLTSERRPLISGSRPLVGGITVRGDIAVRCSSRLILDSIEERRCSNILSLWPRNTLSCVPDALDSERLPLRTTPEVTPMATPRTTPSTTRRVLKRVILETPLSTTSQRSGKTRTTNVIATAVISALRLIRRALSRSCPIKSWLSILSS